MRIFLLLIIVTLFVGCDKQQKAEVASVVNKVAGAMTLDRSEALNLLMSQMRSGLGAAQDLSAIEICNYDVDSWKQLEVAGYIVLDISDNPPAAYKAYEEGCGYYKVSLTEKGKKYSEPPEENGVFLKAVSVVNVEVTGMLNGKTDNGISNSIVEYSVRTVKTPFANVTKLNRLPDGDLHKGKAEFVLYDDGWRIIRNDLFDSNHLRWEIDPVIIK